MPPRKKPFSAKAKKEQLKLKKMRQQETGAGFVGKKTIGDGTDGSRRIMRLNYNPKRGNTNANRYALQFYRETPEEIKERKKKACETIVPVPEEALDIVVDDFFPPDLDFPKRPSWSYDLTKEQLQAREEKYFQDYLKNIQEKHDLKDIGFFELNLETWRQLWRVLEMSDIVLHIVDIRYPAHMFPPSLYDYVTKTLNKDFILVLNKIDLAPSPIVVAWLNYFKEKYPKIYITMFTSLPGYNLIGSQTNKAGLQVRKRKGKFKLAAEGSQQLYDICNEIVGDDLDISSWQTKIKEEMNTEFEYEDDKVEVGETIQLKSVDTGYFKHEKYINGILTIGCLGQPNVGKSSLINAIMGRKVVSVSRTPGHTKHFQTIFLTNNVRLCDCPGLVFPSKVPKTIQVLMGSYPIAQLREPYTTVMYLAERIDLPKLLKIEHPDNDDTWCAMDICDGWAKKRGFYTAKAARLDSYRAANDLLRMTLDGKICLCLRPPLYAKKKEYWMTHPDNEKVKWIQAKSEETPENVNDNKELFSDDEPNPTSSNEDEEDEGNESDTEDDDEEDDDDDEEEEEEDVPKKQAFNKFAALKKVSNEECDTDDDDDEDDSPTKRSFNKFAALQNVD